MVLARQFIGEGAIAHGERLAIVSARTRVTYADLDVRSDRLAGALAAHGVKSGERVVVFMDDTAEAIVAISAVLKAGAVLTPVCAASTAADLAFVFDDCRAAAIITEARLAAVAAAGTRAAASLRLVVLAGGDQGSISETCLSFEEAVGRRSPTPAIAQLAAGAPLPLPLMLVYPRVAGGLGAPVTMTGADVLPDRMPEAAPVGAVIEGIRPLSGARGISGLLAALAEGATIILSPFASIRRSQRASAA